MPRTIKADGRTIIVPDDATPDEINQIVGPAPADTRNGFQREVDDLTKIEPFNARPGVMGHILTGAGNVGGGLLSPLSLLAHPVNSANALVHSLGPGAEFDPQSMQHGLIESAIREPAGTAENLVGGLLGGEAGGELFSGASHALSEPMQAGGAGLVDRAAGSVKPDFAHGAQPGRAYLEGGGKPALTLRGLGEKAEAVKENAGEGLGKAYDAATSSGVKIPSSKLSDAVLDPATRLRATQNAPGGTGETPLLDAYESRVSPYLESQDEFTPREAFDFKRNIAGNTRWNDPTMFDMNSVRQQGVGGVGKVLTDAVPETAPLNRIYQGSENLADRATLRADTGTPPFTSLVNRGLEGAAGLGLGYMTHNPFLAAAPLLMDSVPVKTGAGYLLYQGGKLAGKVPNLGPIGAGTGAVAPLLSQETQ